jgi:hypothetical protein
MEIRKADTWKVIPKMWLSCSPKSRNSLADKPSCGNRGPFLTSPLVANFDPQGRSCPGSELCLLGVKLSRGDEINCSPIESRECSLGMNQGGNITARGQISTLGARPILKFEPLRSEVVAQGWIFFPGGEVIPKGWNSLFAPPFPLRDQYHPSEPGVKLRMAHLHSGLIYEQPRLAVHLVFCHRATCH